MLSKEKNVAVEVEKLMIEIYQKIGVEFRTYVTNVNMGGVRAVSFEP